MQCGSGQNLGYLIDFTSPSGLSFRIMVNTNQINFTHPSTIHPGAGLLAYFQIIICSESPHHLPAKRHREQTQCPGLPAVLSLRRPSIPCNPCRGDEVEGSLEIVHLRKAQALLELEAPPEHLHYHITHEEEYNLHDNEGPPPPIPPPPPDPGPGHILLLPAGSSLPISRGMNSHSSQDQQQNRSDEAMGNGEGSSTNNQNQPQASNSTTPQMDYILETTTDVPAQQRLGEYLLDQPYEVQVRANGGVTARIREHLAHGRLFGVLTIVREHSNPRTHVRRPSYTNTVSISQEEQVVTAVIPIPALDSGFGNDSPPPPYVVGMLSFQSPRITRQGRWRLRVTLMQINNTPGSVVSEEESALSLGSHESEVIIIY
ncbi:hypothetical protein BT63DRAFT_475344 [Microthyrium microscopicum]|uniref:Uncharacterized protein n=1 Tax=Microthyrium microscopicum TaxID=703497 RepID=A0A6A6UKD5_9PEZI|nr:hypothetical protein BT63DRAFT_475344 [Microthyrium microscopicum]